LYLLPTWPIDRFLDRIGAFAIHSEVMHLEPQMGAGSSEKVLLIVNQDLLKKAHHHHHKIRPENSVPGFWSIFPN
jgi:hypothetical protein